MFIINPDPYSLPCYRIGPFQTHDLSVNHNLPNGARIDDYFEERFKGKQIAFTINGRKAINIALQHYELKEDDIVTILSTSGNYYISGCVTTEIEKFCKWSRKIEPQTRLIFVNHEFGYPFHELHKLKSLNLPIIEDCAGSFFSEDIYNDIGNTGDFVIYSFPKMFPIQIGGLLVSNLNFKIQTVDLIPEHWKRYIKNVLSVYIDSKDEIIRQRIFNYYYLKQRIESLGFLERFPLADGTVPGVFMFSIDNFNLDLPELKKYYFANGVQCSVFYGEESFFIPVHQRLNECDLEYFFEILYSYVTQMIK